MRESKISAAVLLVCALFICESRGVAQEGHATGFMLETEVGADTTIIATGTGTASLSGFTPTLRIGAMLKALAIAGTINYFSFATRLANPYAGENVLTFGPDFMPFVWSSADGLARLYLLIGFNIGVDVSSTSNPVVNDAKMTGGLDFGVGGRYFLHRHFALGIELGSRTQFVNVGPGSSDVAAVSMLYGALAGTFVAGK